MEKYTGYGRCAVLCSLDREGDQNPGGKDAMERAGGISGGRKLGAEYPAEVRSGKCRLPQLRIYFKEQKANQQAWEVSTGRGATVTREARESWSGLGISF